MKLLIFLMIAAVVVESHNPEWRRARTMEEREDVFERSQNQEKREDVGAEEREDAWRAI